MTITFPIPDIYTNAPLAAASALMALDKSSLANSTQVALSTFDPSPVQYTLLGCEAIYSDACSANSTTSADAQVLCYQLATMGVNHDFNGYASNGRGLGICLEMRRQLNDPTCTATEAQRPAPQP